MNETNNYYFKFTTERNGKNKKDYYEELKRKEKEKLYLYSIFRIPTDKNKITNSTPKSNNNLSYNNSNRVIKFNNFINDELKIKNNDLERQNANKLDVQNLNNFQPNINKNEDTRNRKGYIYIKKKCNQIMNNSDMTDNINNNTNLNDNQKYINNKVNYSKKDNINSNSKIFLRNHSALNNNSIYHKYQYQFNTPKKNNFINFGISYFRLNNNDNSSPPQKNISEIQSHSTNFKYNEKLNYVDINKKKQNDGLKKYISKTPKNRGRNNNNNINELLVRSKSIINFNSYQERYKNTGYHYNTQRSPQINNNYFHNSIENNFTNYYIINKSSNINKQNKKINNINCNIQKNGQNKEFERELYFNNEESSSSSINNNVKDYFQVQETIKEVDEIMEYSSIDRKSHIEKKQLNKTIKRANSFDKNTKKKNNLKKENFKKGKKVITIIKHKTDKNMAKIKKKSSAKNSLDKNKISNNQNNKNERNNEEIRNCFEYIKDSKNKNRSFKISGKNQKSPENEKHLKFLEETNKFSISRLVKNKGLFKNFYFQHNKPDVILNKSCITRRKNDINIKISKNNFKDLKEKNKNSKIIENKKLIK